MRDQPVYTFYTEIYELPGNKKIIGGRFRIEKMSQFSRGARDFVENAPVSILSDLVREDSNFEAFLKNAIDHENNYRLKKIYRELLPKHKHE